MVTSNLSKAAYLEASDTNNSRSDSSGSSTSPSASPPEIIHEARIHHPFGEEEVPFSAKASYSHERPNLLNQTPSSKSVAPPPRFQAVRQPGQAVASLSGPEEAERQEWRRLQDLDKELWEADIRLSQIEGMIRLGHDLTAVEQKDYERLKRHPQIRELRVLRTRNQLRRTQPSGTPLHAWPLNSEAPNTQEGTTTVGSGPFQQRGPENPSKPAKYYVWVCCQCGASPSAVEYVWNCIECDHPRCNLCSMAGARIRGKVF